MEKNKKIILILGSLIIIAFGFIVYFLLFMNNSDENINKNITKKPVEDEHRHYYDSGDDPFKDKPKDDKEPTITLNDLTFSDPVLLPDATVEGNYPTLIKATEHYLLFEGWGGFVYFYDLESKRGESIAKEAEDIFISEDEKYIFFTKKMELKEEIFYYDVEQKGHRGKIGEAPALHKITNMGFSDGLLYYSYYELGKPTVFYTKILPLAINSNKHLDVDPNNVYKNTSSGGDFVGSEYYVFNPADQYISWVQPGDTKVLPRVKTNVKLTPGHFVSQIEFNKNNDWLIATFTEDGMDGHVYTKEGQIEQFKHVQSVFWLDADNVLILEENIVHIYNLVSKESKQFKTEIGDLAVNGDNIYIKDFENKVYIITKK